MNENLIPQVVIDLGQKYLAAEDSSEKTNVELRINDIIEYLESIKKVKRAGQRRVETYRDLVGRGGVGDYAERNGTSRVR